ncbi:MAG: hypothetical protein U1E26_02970 [Coriobacteriia bacterium]|nr:hypothetical protein [Coriobacteriia bacterium]
MKRSVIDEENTQFGVPIESALARRDRLANSYDFVFGHERVFPELVKALLEEVPYSETLLEVGAATGLLTQPLLSRADSLIALEPSPGMLRRILMSEVANDPRLGTMLGMVEDLTELAVFDNAVVTFTPRRGVGLLTLLNLLAKHVRKSIVMLLDDDGSMDWAFVARSASIQCFDVRIRIVTDGACGEGDQKRAVILVAGVEKWCEQCEIDDAWDLEARVVEVPYPAPRGAATRLVRYFLAGGDRAIQVKTERDGVERLYGNLRTATHRIARDEITVRRTDDGVQLVRLPKASE